MTTTRFATAAAVGCLYTVVAVWLVGAEGRSYRESLRLARELDAKGRSAAEVVTAPVVLAPEPVRPVAPTSPVPSREPVVPGGSMDAPRPAAAASPAPPTPAATGSESLAANREVKPSTPTFINPPVTPDKPSESPGAFRFEGLDLTQLTPEEETRLGAELHGLVLAGNPVDRGGDLRRVRLAAAPLIATVARKEIEYKFTILDSDEINAFSLPGGYIYVSRGLFRLVGETVEPEQDYVLQFALGHEIAHVDLKHALKLIAQGNASAKGKDRDTLRRFMVPIGMGYPDAQEFAADAWAYQRMTGRLDRTRREALMFLIKLQGHAERSGFRNGRELPTLKSGLTLAENHYRAHPAAWDRLDRLKVQARAALGEPSPAAMNAEVDREVPRGVKGP